MGFMYDIQTLGRLYANGLILLSCNLVVTGVLKYEGAIHKLCSIPLHL